MRKLTHSDTPNYSRETLLKFVHHAEARLAEMQELQAPPMVLALCEKTLASWQALLRSANINSAQNTSNNAHASAEVIAFAAYDAVIAAAKAANTLDAAAYADARSAGVAAYNAVFDAIQGGCNHDDC